MTNASKITVGALFLAIFAVLLLITFYIPVLGMVVNLFLSLPFIMFAAKYDRKSSIVFLIAAIFISLIVGSVLSIPLALAYGLTGIVIGDFIREKKSRLASYLAGTVVFLITLVVQYAIAVAFMGIDMIKETMQMLDESMDQSISILSAMGQGPTEEVIKQFEASIQMIETLIPSLFVMASLLIVFLIQLVSFPIIKRFGIDVSKWKPFRELSIPKSLLWYYLLTLLASMLFTLDEGSYWYAAIVNISFILQFFMIVQGLSLVFFITYEKNWPKFIPITTTILMLFLPILLYLVRILGIIDLGFDLRKRIERKS